MKEEINLPESNNAFALGLTKEVAVRLNEYGIQLLKESFIEAHSHAGLNSKELEEGAEEFVKEVCKDGYYRTELRHLMKTFGNSGLASPFEGRKIYFIEDDKRGAKRVSAETNNELQKLLE